MMKIGVTGGIGSGKSTVCRLFAQKGIAVYDSDAAAKRLMQQDDTLRMRLTERFGADTFRDGQLDRSRLAGVVFSDPQALADLNALVHPVVMADFDAWAARAIEKFGPLIINDISAGELDPQMPATAARYGVPYVAMHMKGDPRTMQTLTDYKRDITAEVTAYFETKTADLLAAGIKRENIILDPGFGFAKTTEQNYELLAGLHCLCALGYPVLAGLSRKSMIYRVLDATPAESLAGTVALGWECLRQGAAILRVHDVQEAVDTVRLFDAYERNRK